MNREERNLLSRASDRGLRTEDQLPVGIGDATGAALDSFLVEDVSSARYRNESDLVAEQLRRAYWLTRDPVFSPMLTVVPGSPTRTYENQAATLEANADKITALRERKPDAGLRTLEEIRAAIAKDAATKRAALGRVTANATPTARLFGTLAGTAAGAMTDPVNLATLPLGLPRALAMSSSILARSLAGVGYGAAIAGGTELVIQPLVYDYKQSIDSPYTFNDAALNVMAASVGGGVLLGGAAVVPPLARAGGRGLTDLYRKAVDRGDLAPTPETEAAVRVMEDAGTITEQNPLRDTPAGDQAHLAALQRAEEQIAAGRPVEVGDITAPHLREPAALAPNGIQALDPESIGVDAPRFQFKAGGDEKGVTERLRGVERWEPELAGVSLVYEDKAGRFWIVDGHQRLALAKRLAAGGDQSAGEIRLAAIVMREADGVTPAEATARAALKNIAEGTGTAVDAAKVLRSMDDRVTARMPELPPRSALVADAKALANLGAEAFGAVVNQVVDERYGAIVGRLIKGDSEQSAAIGLLVKAEPANKIQAEAMVRQMQAAGFEKSDTGDLFGGEIAESLYKERAQVLDHAMRKLRRDRSTFKFLVDRESDILGNGRNRLDSDANLMRSSADDMALTTLMADAYSPGVISDALNVAARVVKTGQSPAKAADLVLDAVRSTANTAPTGPERVKLTGLSKTDQKQASEDFIRSQLGRTLEEHRALSERPHLELRAWGRGIQKEFGGRVFFSSPSLKGAERIAEKLAEKNTADAGVLTDVARAGFIVDDYSDIDRIITRLAKHWDVLDEGFKATPVGYFDYTVKVRFGNGTVGELQFWDSALLIAKEGAENWIPKKYLERTKVPDIPGHKYYEIWRSGASSIKEKEAASIAMRRLYAAALSDSSGTWKSEFARAMSSSNIARNSSRETSSDLVNTTAGDTEAQPRSPITKAEPSLRATTGDHSQLPKTSTSSQDLNGIGIDHTSSPSIPEDADLFAEVNRVLEERPDMAIPELTDGGEEVVARSAREALAELDAENSAIEKIIVCMTGGAGRADS